MSGDGQHAVDHRDMQLPRASQRSTFLGILVQCALRALLVVFVAVTLSVEPPNADRWICGLVLAWYVGAVACWCAWALRPASRAAVSARRYVALLMLSADVVVLSVLSVLTGIISPESWTSNMLRNGLFLIPLIAAAQLDPFVSGMIAVPTLCTFLTVAWISKSANEEPWASILLTATVLAALAGGSVALSLIQRSRVDAIRDLAQQRTRLLEEMLGLEKRERQTLSERLHDGALQYVIVARQDLDDVRDGSAEATDRVDTSLKECSQLLRDVVRELHPEVLSRSGLKAALTTLADSIGSRAGLAVHLDADAWPEALRTDADHVLYSAARELSTNAIKHARAQNLHVELARSAGQASLRIADDGVGISPSAMTESVENGHIGMASIRTKVLAAGGSFDVHATSPGTEVEISVPVQ
jgi:two-component system, NarL family, sensor kinase